MAYPHISPLVHVPSWSNQIQVNTVFKCQQSSDFFHVWQSWIRTMSNCNAELEIKKVQKYQSVYFIEHGNRKFPSSMKTKVVSCSCLKKSLDIFCSIRLIQSYAVKWKISSTNWLINYSTCMKNFNENHFSWIYPSVFYYELFQTPAIPTVFHFPWEFEKVGFNCS